MRTLAVFDRWGTQKTPIQLVSAIHTETLDAETLDVTCLGSLVKGDRLVWRDNAGAWHEVIVDSTREAHDGGAVLTTASCVSSLAETLGDVVPYCVYDEATVGTVLNTLAVQSATRWTLASDLDPSVVISVNLQSVTLREALARVVELAGAELVTEITVTDGAITGRTARIVAERGHGEDNPQAHLQYAINASGITRDMGNRDPITAVYAYGKGKDVSGVTGATIRVSLADIPPYVPYVEDIAARGVWGRPGPNGTKEHRYGIYINASCDDPSVLRREAEAYLAANKTPDLSYTASSALLPHNVGIGDYIDVVDRTFTPEVRVRVRVSRIRRDLAQTTVEATTGTHAVSLGDAPAEVTAGTVPVDTTIETATQAAKASGETNTAQATADAVASLGDGYVGTLGDKLASSSAVVDELGQSLQDRGWTGGADLDPWELKPDNVFGNYAFWRGRKFPGTSSPDSNLTITQNDGPALLARHVDAQNDEQSVRLIGWEGAWRGGLVQPFADVLLSHDAVIETLPRNIYASDLDDWFLQRPPESPSYYNGPWAVNGCRIAAVNPTASGATPEIRVFRFGNTVGHPHVQIVCGDVAMDISDSGILAADSTHTNVIL